jgi:exopolyphosphatase/guanosine-5'-triphosphate,3'-diphosphate pyrophosphatase
MSGGSAHDVGKKRAPPPSLDPFLQCAGCAARVASDPSEAPRQLSVLPNSPPEAFGPRFPLRVAAIDIGSNAIRFVAAEFFAPDRFRAIQTVREPVRLGGDAFASGTLQPQVMEAAVAAVAGFRDRMEALGVETHRAVATSAVRDSRNGAALVERVRERCGIRIEAISGAEEARLVWLAIRRRLQLGDREWLLVDLGGGSLEVSLVDAERIHWSDSYPLGTVRLLQALGADGGSPAEVRRLLDEHPSMPQIAEIARAISASGLVGTGGNIEALAELAGARPDGGGVSRLSLPRLREVTATLATLSPRERVAQLGLREDRADVILPAAVVYERLVQLAGSQEVVIPRVGVREGVLHDLVEGAAP